MGVYIIEPAAAEKVVVVDDLGRIAQFHSDHSETIWANVNANDVDEVRTAVTVAESKHLKPIPEASHDYQI